MISLAGLTGLVVIALLLAAAAPLILLVLFFIDLKAKEIW